MTIEVSLLISGVSVAFAIFFGICSKQRNDKKDTQEETERRAENDTMVVVKLENIADDIKDIKRESRENREEMKQLRERVAPYIDPVFQNNVILTKTESLTMNSRPKDPKTARNKNVLAIGGSGSGKTRFWLKPNLMQMHSSYVVTDPKGTILIECGKMLQRGAPKLGKDGKPMKDKHGKVIYEPYRIKVLNTINFKKSMHYNPFAYIHSEKDILKLVTTLIANTKGEGKAGDDFWVKAETLLYCALIGYIHYEAPVEEQNFSTLIEFINAMEVREDDEEFKNPVDLMFDALEAEKPNHFAVRQYKKYKLAAGDICSK